MNTRTGMAALFAAAALALGGCETLPGGDTIDTGHGRMEYALAGQGEGTVVFEAGLGDTMVAWAPIASRVSAFSNTFVYNRAGYGGSGRASERPSAEHNAEALHALLEAAGAPKPWTLVGHSLGGAYVMTFAKLYPEDVHAVVLIDGTSPWQTRALRDDMPGIFNTARTLSGLMGGAARQEFDASIDDGEAYDRLGRFPRIPVTLLQRTQWSPIETSSFQDLVTGLQGRMISQAPCGRAQRVPGAGHYIHRDQPEVVVRTIREATNRSDCR